MTNQDFQIMPCFSLEPNKAVSFNRVFKNSDYDDHGNRIPRKRLTALKFGSSHSSDSQITRQSHNLKLSDNAYRTLKRKINWLYYLAKPKYVKTYNGKEMFNFKIGFLTFTLSSSQKHPTKEVTNLLFNEMLTELRTRTQMENYVWRLEFQKNGNVHYHLVTDTYLDYFFVQKIWNRIQRAHGYVDDYTAKHSAMSLMDYYATYTDGTHNDFPKLAKRYARGKQDKWLNPPSVDVKSVISNKAISNYIAKYFGKDANENPIKNELDTDENTANMRLWFCSRSLSKLNTVTDFCEAVEYDIFSVVRTATKLRTYIAKFAMMFYYEMSSLPKWCRAFVERLLRDYAFNLNYKPSI